MGPMLGRRPRWFRLGACCALGALAGLPAASAEPRAPGRSAGVVGHLKDTHGGLAGQVEEVRPLWSFHAGAPLRAAAEVGEAGIAVGTADGYVHSLRRDGSYRWSFTIKGAVLASPIVGEHGTLYVVSSSRRLYALRPTGTLAWTAQLAGTPLPGLARAKDGAVLIATAEGMLYAVTTSGRMRAAVNTHARLTTLPLALADGRWVVGGENGHLFWLDGWRLRRERLSDSPVLGVAASDSGFVALTSESLFGAEAPQAGPFALLGSGRTSTPVVTKDGKIGRIVAQKVEWLGTLPELPSAPPVALDDGRLLVPLPNGELGVLAASGAFTRLKVATGRLFSPVVDEARKAVVVSATDGRTVALPFGAL